MLATRAKCGAPRTFRWQHWPSPGLTRRTEIVGRSQREEWTNRALLMQGRVPRQPDIGCCVRRPVIRDVRVGCVDDRAMEVEMFGQIPAPIDVERREVTHPAARLRGNGSG